jgi:hypothetical protein
MKWRSTALVQGLHNNAVMGNLQGQRGKVFQGHCIARNIARAALELRHAPWARDARLSWCAATLSPLQLGFGSCGLDLADPGLSRSPGCLCSSDEQQFKSKHATKFTWGSHARHGSPHSQ